VAQAARAGAFVHGADKIYNLHETTPRSYRHNEFLAVRQGIEVYGNVDFTGEAAKEIAEI